MLAEINNFGAKFSNNEGLPGIHDVNSVLRLRKTLDSPLRLPTLEDLNKALK